MTEIIAGEFVVMGQDSSGRDIGMARVTSKYGVQVFANVLKLDYDAWVLSGRFNSLAYKTVEWTPSQAAEAAQPPGRPAVIGTKRRIVLNE